MNAIKLLTTGRRLPIAAAFLVALAGQLSAQISVPIPNGDFSDPGNAGTIGGVIDLTPDPAAPLGSGPWSARTEGIDIPLTPIDLAAPTVDISSGPGGDLSFSGLAVANPLGLGILSTEAEAFVTSTTGFLADSMYTLTFDFNSASILDVGLLSDLGFGVSLTANGTATSPGILVANSIDDPLLLNLSILGGTTGTGTLSFTTGAIAPTGNLGVRFAFGEADGTLNVAALSGINIDNVAVSVTPVPEPGSLLLFAVGLLGLFRRHRRVAHA